MAVLESKVASGHIPLARQHDLRLRERFQLPEYESCIEHFSCAYSSKILRQGHIYVMLRHVCFNSGVFPTPVKIHAADIKSILPKSNLFLPNSIEIVENNGTKHFFTSFLSRERCLELITSRWQTELARAADTVPMATPTTEANPEANPEATPVGHEAANGDDSNAQNMSMRRRGWPVSAEPPPDPAELASNGWTNVLDQALQGWEVFDVIKVFEDDDNFFQDWHDSLGDTDVKIGEWRLGEEEDREREVGFTARIHDPPIGSSRTVKVVAHQKARLHGDGTFSADFHNTMPLVTVAKFRVEFLWRIAQAGGRAHVLVWVRAHFMKPSILKATIASQSVSQGISCYTQLRQRLVLRFPPQGSRPDQRDHISDVAFALRIAKDASARMPRAWQEHLLSTLSERPTVQVNAYSNLIGWGSSAVCFVLVALLATFIVLPSINLKLQPPHAAMRESLDVITAMLPVAPLHAHSHVQHAPAAPAAPSGSRAARDPACAGTQRAWGNESEPEGEDVCRTKACADDAGCAGAQGRCSDGNCDGERDKAVPGAVAQASDIAADAVGALPSVEQEGDEGPEGGAVLLREPEGEWAGSSYGVHEEASDEWIEMQLLEVVQRERRLLEAAMRRRRQRAKATAGGDA